jgi:DNA-binding CsgD family transcriptional regulator
MLDVEYLSELVGEIYDAALDHALWPEILGKTREFVGGSAATLFWKDVAAGQGDIYYDDGTISPHFKQLYFKRYVTLDPASTRHYFAEIEKPLSTADLMDYDEFCESRMYKEWARPQGLVDFITAVLDKSTTSAAMFGVFRHERHGLANDETRRRMRLIVPHIRRSTLIGKVIDLKAAEAASLADACDGLSAGMFLVDADGRIVHANASAHAMIASGAVFRASDGRLVARDPRANQTLREIYTAAGGGDLAIGIKGIAVPLATQDGARYVASVLPLTSGSRRKAGANYAASAALFVHRAALVVPSPPEVIAKTFDLTPSELRVLLGIVEVGGVPETAEALGVAETTVKTHLRNVFAKTETARQADLVKLIAGFSSPITC